MDKPTKKGMIMEITFIALALASTLFAAEIFKCERYHTNYETSSGSSHLEAVYVDGILRGRITSSYKMTEIPSGSAKSGYTYIQAQADGITIKSIRVYFSETYGNRSYTDDGYPYFYYYTTETFYLPLSINELNLIRRTDDNGKKCLSIWSSPYP